MKQLERLIETLRKQLDQFSTKIVVESLKFHRETCHLLEAKIHQGHHPAETRIGNDTKRHFVARLVLNVYRSSCRSHFNGDAF